MRAVSYEHVKTIHVFHYGLSSYAEVVWVRLDKISSVLGKIFHFSNSY